MTKFSNRLMAFSVLAVSSALSHSQVTPAQTRGGLWGKHLLPGEQWRIVGGCLVGDAKAIFQTASSGLKS